MLICINFPFQWNYFAMAYIPKSLTTKLRTLYEISGIIHSIPKPYMYCAPFWSDKILRRDEIFLASSFQGNIYLKNIVSRKRKTSLIKLPYPGLILGIVALKIRITIYMKKFT